MPITEISTLISTVGFPICVAMYVLITLNKSVQENTRVMNIIADKLNISTAIVTPPAVTTKENISA